MREAAWLGQAAAHPEQPNHRSYKWLDPGHDPAPGWKYVAHLAGDHDAVPTGAEGATQKSLALSLAVHIRGIEKRHTGVERGQEDRNCNAPTGTT